MKIVKNITMKNKVIKINDIELVKEQVWMQYRNEVYFQVRKYIDDQVWNEVREQVYNQVRDQVYIPHNIYE